MIALDFVTSYNFFFTFSQSYGSFSIADVKISVLIWNHLCKIFALAFIWNAKAVFITFLIKNTYYWNLEDFLIRFALSYIIIKPFAKYLPAQS